MTKKQAIAEVIKALGGTPAAGNTADLIAQLSGLVTTAEKADLDLADLTAEVAAIKADVEALKGEDEPAGGGES